MPHANRAQGRPPRYIDRGVDANTIKLWVKNHYNLAPASQLAKPPTETKTDNPQSAQAVAPPARPSQPVLKLPVGVNPSILLSSSLAINRRFEKNQSALTKLAGL